MWLNRLDDRPQSNSQTIAPDYFPSGDCSSCDGTFFLKVNRYKLSQCANAQKPSCQVDSFRRYVGYATAFVKHAGQANRRYAALICIWTICTCRCGNGIEMYSESNRSFTFLIRSSLAAK